MFRQRRFPAGLVAAGALAASVACDDHRTTTAPLAPTEGRFASAADARRASEGASGAVVVRWSLHATDAASTPAMSRPAGNLH